MKKNLLYGPYVVSDSDKPVVRKKSIKFPSFVIQNNGKDNWFLTKAREIVYFKDVEFDGFGHISHLVGQKVIDKTNFYEQPIQSSLLNIYKSKGDLDIQRKWSLNDVESKMFCIKDLDKQHVFFPIVHTYKED